MSTSVSGVVTDVIWSPRVLASAAAVAIVLAAFGASAQQPAPQGPIIFGKPVKIAACQGLPMPQCVANPGCEFVPESRRKDGKPIPAFCRAKPVQR